MSQKKNIYITTAIPYANAKPHIGNALDYLQADIVARYHRLNGREVRFQVGTDEHGNKIAAKAKESNLDPQSYVDSMYGNFENLMKAVNTSYTDFIRTTDPKHKKAVQYIWQKLQPYIYKDAYDGWYCVGHEAFFTDREVQESGGVCPDHQTQFEKVSEENYFFRLSAFGDQIREAIQSKKMQILPKYRENEILKLIDKGLEDISVSRTRGELSWGVPVPGDESQVMYVWIDALSNYITVLGYPDDETWREFWPADVQVIGKDILRFHAAIWPAILLALDLPLPKRLLAHGFVNVGGAKMSKTVGNVVDPIEIIDNFGADAFRYYFSRHIPTMDDGDFTWEKFENAYNNELSNDLGNLVQRVVAMLNRYQAGVIGDQQPARHDSQIYHDAMRDLEFDKAISEVWVTVQSLNKYLENVKPWEIAKNKDTDPEAEAHLSEVLTHAVGTLRQIAELLMPFMPQTAEAIERIFAGGAVASYQGVLFPKKYIHTPDPRTKSSSL